MPASRTARSPRNNPASSTPASAPRVKKATAAAKKAAPKKAAAKKAAPKKASPKKATPKKAVTKKATAQPQAPKKATVSTAPKTPVAALPTTASEAPRRRAAARALEESLEQIWVTYKRTQDLNLRNILIESHMALVRTIAERLLQTLPKSIDVDDLTSAGTFGLMDAIDGFDLSRGIKFKTYCTTRIRGSILDELRSQDWVPRLVRLKAHRLEKAVRKLEGDLGRDPNSYEIAEAMGMSIIELQATETEAHAKTIFSLSEKWDESEDDKEMEKVEILADKKGPDPVQTIHQRDILELITRNLTKKERLIIIMYYYEGLTMREIGEIMELTESRVCQIHSNVMSRLKAQLDHAHLQAG